MIWSFRVEHIIQYILYAYKLCAGYYRDPIRIREHILLLTIQSDSDECVFIFRNTMMFISIDEYFLHTQVRVKQVHCVVRIYIYIYTAFNGLLLLLHIFFYITKLLNWWYEIAEWLTIKNNTAAAVVCNII